MELPIWDRSCSRAAFKVLCEAANEGLFFSPSSTS